MARGQGDEKALTALLPTKDASTIINRCVSKPNDAIDILQQCLMDVWQRQPRDFSAKASPWAGSSHWLVAAIDWCAVAAHERGKERQLRAHVEMVEDGVAGGCGATIPPKSSPLTSRLPVEQQEVIKLAFYRMSQRQVAAHTGKPLGTIKTRIELGYKLRSAAMALAGRCGSSSRRDSVLRIRAQLVPPSR
jgi:RNA polymerase sigma-70 factor (ECF subfamily)